MFRIGYGGICIESSSFVKARIKKDEFAFWEGEKLLTPWITKPASELGAQLIPLSLAGSTPSGAVQRDEWINMCEEFISRLKKALPLDGLLLRCHGSALFGSGDSGELELLERIRGVVGKDFPIALPLDLHGNLTQRIVDLATFITAYRTAPHRDGMETVTRALRVLCQILKKEVLPRQHFIKLPILLPGEKVITEVSPGKELYGMIEHLCENPEILDCSIFVGFGWADCPQAGASVLAVSRDNPTAAKKAAMCLAQEFWNQRKSFAFEGKALLPDEALEEAKREQCAVFVSDSGDNISAGAPGDSVFMLKKLLEHGVKEALFAPLVDKPATDECFRLGKGSEIEVTIGGTLSGSGSIKVSGIVRELQVYDDLKVAVLRLPQVEVVLLSRRDYFYDPAKFKALGIDLLSKKIVVVKLGYLFPELRDIAPVSIIALSPGLSALLLETFEYHNLTRPIFPFDADVEFSLS